MKKNKIVRVNSTMIYYLSTSISTTEPFWFHIYRKTIKLWNELFFWTLFGSFIVRLFEKSFRLAIWKKTTFRPRI